MKENPWIVLDETVDNDMQHNLNYIKENQQYEEIGNFLLAKIGENYLTKNENNMEKIILWHSRIYSNLQILENKYHLIYNEPLNYNFNQIKLLESYIKEINNVRWLKYIPVLEKMKMIYLKIKNFCNIIIQYERISKDNHLSKSIKEFFDNKAIWNKINYNPQLKEEYNSISQKYSELKNDTKTYEFVKYSRHTEVNLILFLLMNNKQWKILPFKLHSRYEVCDSCTHFVFAFNSLKVGANEKYYEASYFGNQGLNFLRQLNKIN